MRAADAAVLVARRAPIVERFELVIPGPPQPKERPRFNAWMADGEVRRRTRTSTRTRLAEDYARRVWIDAGAPRLPEAPLRVWLGFYLSRPSAHYNRAGISPRGHREATAAKGPDVDNLAKLVLDALNGLAWPDDRYIVELRVWKRLEDAKGRARTEVRAEVVTEA